MLPRARDRGADAGEVLRLAAGADQPSGHPLAEAIVRGALERGTAPAAPERFEALPGLGVTASA